MAGSAALHAGRLPTTSHAERSMITLTARIRRCKSSVAGRHLCVDGTLLAVEGASNFVPLGKTVRITCTQPPLADFDHVHTAVTGSSSSSNSSISSPSTDVAPRPARVKGCAKGERRKWAIERSMAKANGTLAAVARAEEEPRVLIFANVKVEAYYTFIRTNHECTLGGTQQASSISTAAVCWNPHAIVWAFCRRVGKHVRPRSTARRAYGSAVVRLRLR